MSIEDRNGHLHGAGGKYAEKPVTAPGVSATLTAPEKKHSYQAPRPGRTYCNSATSFDCLAPAGYGTSLGTASVSGVRKADLYECAYCCEPLCHNCAVTFGDKRACDLHDPEQVRAWLGRVDRSGSVASSDISGEASGDSSPSDPTSSEQTLDRVRAVLGEWGLDLASPSGTDDDEDFAEAIRDSGAWRLARDLRNALTPHASAAD